MVLHDDINQLIDKHHIDKGYVTIRPQDMIVTHDKTKDTYQAEVINC